MYYFLLNYQFSLKIIIKTLNLNRQIADYFSLKKFDFNTGHLILFLTFSLTNNNNNKTNLLDVLKDFTSQYFRISHYDTR